MPLQLSTLKYTAKAGDMCTLRQLLCSTSRTCPIRVLDYQLEYGVLALGEQASEIVCKAKELSILFASCLMDAGLLDSAEMAADLAGDIPSLRKF